MKWLEVSLTLDGELAEAVAEVFSRHARNGVTMEQGIVHLHEGDSGTPEGPITVRAYLPVDGNLDQTRRKLVESLHFLGVIKPIPEPQFKTIEDQNWMEAWRVHYKPILIGRRLTVLPAWLEAPDPGRIAIKIDPGMAFGTGTHPSTQLCLQLIDDLLSSDAAAGLAAARDRVFGFIDVGCGSGILSIAAIKLGAGRVLGVDTDAEAVRNARENAQLNGSESNLELAVGSVGEILAGSFGPRSGMLVAANILAPVIVNLLEDGLASIVEPGGDLLLSGILDSQARLVEAAAVNAGLLMMGQRRMGEWVALWSRRPAAPGRKTGQTLSR